jgi:hypothetical protein
MAVTKAAAQALAAGRRSGRVAVSEGARGERQLDARAAKGGAGAA